MPVTVESILVTGRLEADIKVTAEVNFTAVAARQKVNSFVLNEVSYMMHAGIPTLCVGECIRWRVPVILSLASKGDVGEVGAIEVDVETGQMAVTPQLLAEMDQRAQTFTPMTPFDDDE